MVKPDVEGFFLIPELLCACEIVLSRQHSNVQYFTINVNNSSNRMFLCFRCVSHHFRIYQCCNDKMYEIELQ